MCTDNILADISENNKINKDINSSYDPSILVDGCNELGIRLNDGQIMQFINYYSMLCERNRVMNLTAITDWEDVQVKHYLDSLLLCRAAELNNTRNIIDIGTGAGFPGIVLKIAFPHLRIVLADSLKKRILFLNEVIEKLGLSGIEAVHCRAEDLGHMEGYRESFDMAVSRAVANLSSLSEYCIPFVKKSGWFISYKSAEVDDEVNKAVKAVKILGGRYPEIKSFNIPCSGVKRSFVIIRKEKSTPDRYPRKAGIPSRNPLS